MAYDYGENIGPHTWAVHFPFAGGKRQSPINLCDPSLIIDTNLEPLSIDLRGVERQSIVMKPHNFQVSVHGTGVLTGGPLTSEYYFKQFHFHWGSGDTWGSEHQINGVCSPGELHCVFENSECNESDPATERPDGIVVVGIFLKLGNTSNRALHMILENMDDIEIGEERTISPPIPISALLPDDLSKYYTYHGSLTTPPCSECVRWFVLNEPIEVTRHQLHKLRRLHAKCESCGRTDNYRPVCPIGSRRVRRSFE